MKKKLLVLALIMAAALIFAVACGGDDNNESAATPAPTATPEADTNQGTDDATTIDEGGSRWGDTIQVSVSVWDASASFAGEPCELYQYIQDRFGLTFEPVDIGWDNMSELPLLWAAADTLPDIIGGIDMGIAIYRDWIDSGLVRSLPDDLTRWPTLNHWMTQAFMLERMVDGEHYFIPR